MRKKIVFAIVGLLVVIAFFPIINGSQNNENQIILQISQTPDKLLIKDKIIGDLHISYWQHVVNGVVIKNDYILLQENHIDDSIIKFEKQWTDIPDLVLDILKLDFHTFKIDENLVSWKEKVLFLEENDLKSFYSVDNNQFFPLLCLEVRYKDGNTILYDINGDIIGKGVPAPYEGFSMTGYNDASWPDPWLDWRLNADSWFKKWCDSSISISLPMLDVISSYVSNPEYCLFFELAHGDSTCFQADSTGVYYCASDVEYDMAEREKNIFSFIGSCEGMTYTGDGTFSYEFRKGSLVDTVTVGYSGMGSCPGWSVALYWQDFMFYAMDSYYTILDAFNLACAEYPSISDCVVFVGDPDLKIVEPEEQDEDNIILPHVIITYPKELSIVSGNIKITGTADHLDGEIKRVYIQIDDGEWQKAFGTYNWELFWNTSTVQDGLHKIVAVAVDDKGSQSCCYNCEVYVVNNFLEADIICPNQALINQQISFQVLTSGGISPYNYTWDFGDGTPQSNELNPIHQYIEEGIYNVTLKVKDNTNTTVTDITTVTVLLSMSDLECEEALNWNEVKPGITVDGLIIVKNDGGPMSKLNWEIDSYPDWGTWTFTPSEGTGLTPENGTITVKVTLVTPKAKSIPLVYNLYKTKTEDFTGNITVINKDYPSDKEVIPVSITVSKNKAFAILDFYMLLIYRFSFFEKILKQILSIN